MFVFSMFFSQEVVLIIIPKSRHSPCQEAPKGWEGMDSEAEIMKKTLKQRILAICCMSPTFFWTHAVGKLLGGFTWRLEYMLSIWKATSRGQAKMLQRRRHGSNGLILLGSKTANASWLIFLIWCTKHKEPPLRTPREIARPRSSFEFEP